MRSEDGRRFGLVMLRFSRMVTPLVALMIVSGIYNGANFFVTPDDIDTGYGRALGVKLLIVAPLLLIGAWQHIALRPQLAERLNRACAIHCRGPCAHGWRKRSPPERRYDSKSC